MAKNSLHVSSAKYIDNYVLEIEFSDGTTQVVNFEQFLKISSHHNTRYYLNKDVFQEFMVEDGQLHWGNHDLEFDVEKLHRNELLPPSLPFKSVKKASKILRAVNHKVRRRIIELLEENTRMTVTEIFIKLRIEQSAASQHLAILRNEDIVFTKRDGKYIHYSLNYERIDEVMRFVKSLTGKR
ncbi:MAG: metalloregulator ArsR/SmtB family transcription factor [Chitinophagales bacterium]